MKQKNFFYVHVFGGIWKVWDILCRVIINTTSSPSSWWCWSSRASPAVAAMQCRRLRRAGGVDIQGELVEQYSGDPAQRALDNALRATATKKPQTRLRDVLAADPGSEGMTIASRPWCWRPTEMGGAGCRQPAGSGPCHPRLPQNPASLCSPMGSAYDQGQYYLASMAGTVFIHPMGDVFLRGFGICLPALLQGCAG